MSDVVRYPYRIARNGITDLDVIAFEGRGLVSRAISLITGGTVTHVGLALWVGDSLMLLESRELRGGRIVWMSREIQAAGEVLWFRRKEFGQHADVVEATKWAQRAAGAPYSYRGCLRFLRRFVPWKPMFLREPDQNTSDYSPRFCSAFVATVYRQLGLSMKFGKLDSETSPNDVASSPALELIGRIVFDEEPGEPDEGEPDPAVVDALTDSEPPVRTIGAPVGS